MARKLYIPRSEGRPLHTIEFALFYKRAYRYVGIHHKINYKSNIGRSMAVLSQFDRPNKKDKYGQ